MECSVDTVKTNEDRNVMARNLCGNLWWELQTETIILSLHKLFGVFSILFVILNYKELANFKIPSDYPRLWYHYPQALT